MSAIGPKRTSLVSPHMSSFGGKADIANRPLPEYTSKLLQCISGIGAIMKRRDFIRLVGGTIAAVPLATYAQQSAPKIVGVLSPEGPKTGNVDGLVQGPRELGYVEGRNVRFEYRWAEGKFDLLLNWRLIWCGCR